MKDLTNEHRVLIGEMMKLEPFGIIDKNGIILLVSLMESAEEAKALTTFIQTELNMDQTPNKIQSELTKKAIELSSQEKEWLTLEEFEQMD